MQHLINQFASFAKPVDFAKAAEAFEPVKATVTKHAQAMAQTQVEFANDVTRHATEVMAAAVKMNQDIAGAFVKAAFPKNA